MSIEKFTVNANKPFFDGFNQGGVNLGDALRNTFNDALTDEISQLQGLQHDIAQPDFSYGQPEDHSPVAREFLRRMLEGLVGALGIMDQTREEEKEEA